MQLGRAIGGACVAIGALALAAMMLATVADVVGRNTVGWAVPGVVEIVEFTMVVATFAGIAGAFAFGGHITVDLADAALGRNAGRRLGSIAGVATAIAMAGLAYLAWGELGEAQEWGDTTVDLGIPLAAFWVAIVAGYALGAVLAALTARPAP